MVEGIGVADLLSGEAEDGGSVGLLHCVGGCGVGGCGINAAVSLSNRIGGINAVALLLEDDDEDDEGWSKELGWRICPGGQKTGGRWDTVVSVVGQWQRWTQQGGSAPDNGNKVVGVCTVLSSTTKSTDRVALLLFLAS